MTTTFTASLRLAKPGLGDSGWGPVVTGGATDLTDSAIAGYTTVSMPSNADYTLTVSNGAADEARSMMLNITSAVSLTATRNIICPTASKLYFVKNATTGSQSIVFKTSGGSGITIPNGSTAALACNGTNVIAAFDWLSSISFSGTITGTFSGPLNGTVGATTPNTGAFTTLSASSTVSGTGFSTYLASPPAIGGTAAAAGSFTTLNVSGVLTSGNLADTAGYKGIPQNSQTTSYTLALSDMGKHISITTGGITIPANGTVAFPIGSAVMIFNNSGSSQTIAITTDTLRQAGTANTGSRTLAQYGVATCLKVASTTWVISGAGVS